MHRVPGSDTVAFRGEAVVDEHIGRLYTSFLNTTKSIEWVRFLSKIEDHPLPPGGGQKAAVNGSPMTHLVYQEFDMPWPLRNREVLLHRSIRLDKRARTMHATYHSTEHPLHPISRGAVRAHVHWTSWLLRAVGNGQTCVEFETHADPGGSMPTPLVTYMQRSFPRNTMEGFVSSARGAPVHSLMAKW
ncbi:unnamed protein product [Discosporangium mesarthrocarpum]